MIRISSAAGLALFVMASGAFADPAAAPAPDADGFTPLFNGKDLSGWINLNCAPDTWSVRDGMIHSTGKPVGALRLEKQYENFVLELEWRHLTSGGNAGVFIWASPLPATGQPFLRAIEVQVLDHGYGNTESHTTHGDVFAIQGASMKPFPPSRGMRSFPTEQRSKASPEWNHYRVTCQNGTIRLAVNGKDVSGGEECDWHKGYLGLESEGAPVDWRNLRIKELPPAKPAPGPEAAAPAAPKMFQLLYNGANLDGWKTAPGWKAADWNLAFEGKEGAPLEGVAPLAFPAIGGVVPLTSVQFDIRLDEPLEAIPVRIGKTESFPAKLSKGWHRVKLNLSEKEIAWSVDGEASGKAARTAAAEDRLVLAPAAPCRFSAIYLLGE